MDKSRIDSTNHLAQVVSAIALHSVTVAVTAQIWRGLRPPVFTEADDGALRRIPAPQPSAVWDQIGEAQSELRSATIALENIAPIWGRKHPARIEWLSSVIVTARDCQHELTGPRVVAAVAKGDEAARRMVEKAKEAHVLALLLDHESDSPARVGKLDTSKPAPRSAGEPSKQERVNTALERIVKAKGWPGPKALIDWLAAEGIANVTRAEIDRAVRGSTALRAAKGTAKEAARPQPRTISGQVDFSNTATPPAQYFADDGDPADNVERQELIDNLRKAYEELGAGEAGEADGLEVMTTDELEPLWEVVSEQLKDHRRQFRQARR